LHRRSHWCLMRRLTRKRLDCDPVRRTRDAKHEIRPVAVQYACLLCVSGFLRERPAVGRANRERGSENERRENPLRQTAGRPAGGPLHADQLGRHEGPAHQLRRHHHQPKGKFTLDGKTYTLATNNDENHLHGGIKGFDKCLWDAETVETDGAVGVRFTYLSKDGEEGYPGNLKVTALYTLTDSGEFKAQFSATTDKTTVVNLAHHTYWNLGGAAAGDILSHELMLAADKYTPVDAGLIPTGELKDVKGTPMDFTAPTAIGARIAQVEGGYDHNFVLRTLPRRGV